MNVEATMDERGKRCPLPVVALMRATTQLPAGSVVAVLSDDPAAAHDIPAWCRLKGAQFIEKTESGDDRGGHAYVVRLPA